MLPLRAYAAIAAALSVLAMLAGAYAKGRDDGYAVQAAEYAQERAEAHALGDAGPRGERGHGLEALPRAVAVHRLEVVEAPRTVEAQVFGVPHAADELVPRHPLLGEVEAEAHGAQPTPTSGGSPVSRPSRPDAATMLPRTSGAYSFVPLSPGCRVGDEAIALGECVVIDRAEGIALAPDARALLCWPC